MRNRAVRAYFYPDILVNCPAKHPPAFFSKEIKWAVAKQAVKIIFRLVMTWEEYAFLVGKKFMTVLHLWLLFFSNIIAVKYITIKR